MKSTYKNFLIFNCFFAYLIGFKFTLYAPQTYDINSLSFLILSLFGHMSFLMLGFGFILYPILYLKKRWLQKGLFALFFSFGLYLLVIDAIVFSHYRVHIDPVLISLMMSKQVYSFSTGAWLIASSFFLLIFGTEYLLLRFLECSLLDAIKKRVRFLYFFLFVIAALIGANILNSFAVAKGNQAIGAIRRVFPLYYPIRANAFMVKMGIVDKELIEKTSKFELNHSGSLNYPKGPLSFKEVEKKKNIIVIAIDCWRYDAYSQENTPNIWNFTHQFKAHSFNNHMSSGNCTRTGIFGLFYGIPGTYWAPFLSEQKEPVLFQRLKELNYYIQAYPSAPLINPEFHRTVFSGIENLNIETKGESAYQRDIKLTDNWIDWIENKKDEQPFFSFLFYDAPHAYNYPPDYPKVFEPKWEWVSHLLLSNTTDPTEYKNLYKTCVHFVDSQIGRVLNTLKKRQLLDNTIVIITGDHAEEFNDNKQNYWGHNGNFTRFQVQVPFLWYHPEESKDLSLNAEGSFMTSHEDLASSLMQESLGCNSLISLYSTGKNLFQKIEQREWLLSSAYAEYAILENDKIMHVSRYGTYEYLNKNNKPLNHNIINFNNFEQALESMRSFYK